jgi:DNA-binding MarR family transcriptional regulator
MKITAKKIKNNPLDKKILLSLSQRQHQNLFHLAQMNKTTISELIRTLLFENKIK